MIVIDRTERLDLVILQPEEAPLLQNYWTENREHLAPWEPLRTDEYYTLRSMTELVVQRELQFRSRASACIAAISSANQNMVGACNFTNISFGVFQACNLGFSVHCGHVGKGMAHEMVIGGIKYAFEELNLHRIMANFMPRNERSRKLLETLGFEEEGYARSYLKINGLWEDHVLTSLLNPH